MRNSIVVFLVTSAFWPQVVSASFHDAAGWTQYGASEVMNFAKWAKTEVDAAQTQLNTLNTYENTVLQVARFGNPAALRSLPGISTVAEMYQVYGQLSRDYVTAQALLNPQRY